MIEQCIEILQLTHDGNDLEPSHLELIQLGVNAQISAEGKRRLRALHQLVKSGHYTKPFLCGVPHVTRDHQGYVYWKGISVEHFSFAQMTPTEVQEATKQVASGCSHLEALEIPVCSHSYLSPWFEQMPLNFNEAYKEFLFYFSTFYERPDATVAVGVRGHCDELGWPKEARIVEIQKGALSRRILQVADGEVEYHAIIKAGYRCVNCGQPKHAGPSLDQVVSWLQAHHINEDVARQLVAIAQKNEEELTTRKALSLKG